MKKYLTPTLFSLIIFISIISFFKIEKVKPAEIEIEMEVKVPEDDLFMVYYLQEGMKALNDQKSSYIRIKGSDEFQKLHLTIPTDLPLETIRIDIGRNINQKPMEIKYISLKSPSAKYTYDKNIFEAFKPNYFIDLKGETILTKEVAGRYDPFLSPEQSISMVLKELIKEYYPRPVWLPYILGFIFSLSIFLFLYQKNLKLYQPINCAEIYIVVFIGLLLSPTAFKAFMTDERVNNIENRELASMPDFSLSEDFAENFETYYNDNFGLRNNLIEWSSKLKINLFRSSPRPNEVKFGKSQFLFYNKTNDIFDNYTHRD